MSIFDPFPIQEKGFYYHGHLPVSIYCEIQFRIGLQDPPFVAELDKITADR